MIRLILQSAVTGSKDYLFSRVQLPEVSDSPNFEEYGNRKYRIILY
jgi:hypothetical protein